MEKPERSEPERNTSRKPALIKESETAAGESRASLTEPDKFTQKTPRKEIGSCPKN
jgi:hypothetical protein